MQSMVPRLPPAQSRLPSLYMVLFELRADLLPNTAHMIESFAMLAVVPEAISRRIRGDVLHDLGIARRYTRFGHLSVLERALAHKLFHHRELIIFVFKLRDLQVLVFA